MADGENTTQGYLRLLPGCETWCCHGNKCTGTQARAMKSVLHVNPDCENQSHVHKSWGGSDVDDPVLPDVFIRNWKKFHCSSESSSDALWCRYRRETHEHTQSCWYPQTIYSGGKRQNNLCVSTGKSMFSLFTSLIVSVKKDNWNLVSLYCLDAHTRSSVSR